MTSEEIVKAMVAHGGHHNFVSWCRYKGYIHGGIHIKTYKGSFLKEWLEEYDLERGLLPFNENMERLQKTIDYYEERVKKLQSELAFLRQQLKEREELIANLKQDIVRLVEDVNKAYEH